MHLYFSICKDIIYCSDDDRLPQGEIYEAKCISDIKTILKEHTKVIELSIQVEFHLLSEESKESAAKSNLFQNVFSFLEELPNIKKLSFPFLCGWYHPNLLDFLSDYLINSPVKPRFNIEKLNFSGADIEDDNIQKIVEILRKFPIITNIDIANCVGVQFDGITSLVKLIRDDVEKIVALDLTKASLPELKVARSYIERINNSPEFITIFDPDWGVNFQIPGIFQCPHYDAKSKQIIDLVGNLEANQDSL